MKASLDITDDINTFFEFQLILKKQLLYIFENFINIIDISFDIIDKNILKNIKKKIENSKKNDVIFKSFYIEIYNILHPINEQLKMKKKPKQSPQPPHSRGRGDFDFLIPINIFGIQFELFKNENKNTKKSLVNNLYQFYNISKFLKNINEINDSDSDNNKILIQDIQNLLSLLDNIDISSTDSIEKHTINKDKVIENESNGAGFKFNINDLFNKMNISNLDELKEQPENPLNILKNTPFGSILQNKAIIDIVNDLTNDLSKQMESAEFNPMNLLNSLMSGNIDKNENFNSFLSSTMTKITNKIENGEIDKNEIETQAQTIMTSLFSKNE